MPSSDLVEISRQGEVMHFVMARPPANALGLPLVEALEGGLDAFEASDARALVVSSAIPGFFAAGADLKYISTLGAAQFEHYRDALRSPLDRIASCGRPSIAAIDGFALGGGLELAMACSLRIATARSRLGLPEVKLGLIPGAGGTQRLTRLVGAGRALDLMLSGREIEGPAALDSGLVNAVVEDDVVAYALDYAARLARWPSASIDAIMQCVEAAMTTPERGMELEGYAVARLFADGHADAGIAAFLGKLEAARADA
jgi:enoyl-CoA hydratase/carnithine racemase